MIGIVHADAENGRHGAAQAEIFHQDDFSALNPAVAGNVEGQLYPVKGAFVLLH